MKWQTRKENEKRELEIAILIGVEFGVRQHEKGKNLQECLSLARRVLQNEDAFSLADAIKTSAKLLVASNLSSPELKNNPETVSATETSKSNTTERKTDGS